MKRCLFIFVVIFILFSCARRPDSSSDIVRLSTYAQYFDLMEKGSGIVTVSPFNGRRDTLIIDEPLNNIVCMSSSNVAALSEIGADSVITAVSGVGYISNPSIRERYFQNIGRKIYDIGYEGSLDYERILELKPDLVVAYTVSGVEPPYLAKLRNLGIPILILYDHLESHPLARAEYIRLFGVITGRSEQADSRFKSIAKRYEEIAEAYRNFPDEDRIKVLMNIPYADAWYVPGENNYMSCLVNDAGGEILGAEEGKEQSGIITIEKAYRLSQQADLWLNPGQCRSIVELSSIHQLFPQFGPLKNDFPIYNNTLRTTPEGGNDFWESGAVRPDLILEDLQTIFRKVRCSSGDIHEGREPELKYYFPVE